MAESFKNLLKRINMELLVFLLNFFTLGSRITRRGIPRRSRPKGITISKQELSSTQK